MPTNIGSGASLPFTGIGDVLAPLMLALMVVLGGVVAWRWAQLREAVAKAASQRRHAPVFEASVKTGYDAGMRRMELEKRARRVFSPRVA